MTRVYDENGHAIPVTVIEAGPCVVLQRKTAEKEGYDAVQLGFLPRRQSRITRAEAGHCKRAGLEHGFYHVREFRVQPDNELAVGQELAVSTLFKIGDKVNISGVSKGRGFQGVSDVMVSRGGVIRTVRTSIVLPAPLAVVPGRPVF